MARWGRRGRYGGDGGWGGGYGGWRPYVPVAEKRARGARAVARLEKAGRKTAPVVIEGRKIARTFWGQAWCQNLESYGDYANRLPRGRTYVRNGSVLDLQIGPGKVTALVCGSELYEVTVTIRALQRARWRAITRECAGQIDSVIELLGGQLTGSVMQVVSRRGDGLFPAPAEITLACSCPDYARLCKHVAAALYGIGARLDEDPGLLFTLREVDPADLVEGMDAAAALGEGAAQERVLASDDLAAVFGIELDSDAGAAAPPSTPRARRRAAKAPQPAKKKQRKAKASPPRATTSTAQELIARGVPRPTIQGWLRQGVLLPTGQRGVYRLTPAARERLASYRAS